MLPLGNKTDSCSVWIVFIDVRAIVFIVIPKGYFKDGVARMLTKEPVLFRKSLHPFHLNRLRIRVCKPGMSRVKPFHRVRAMHISGRCSYSIEKFFVRGIVEILKGMAFSISCDIIRAASSSQESISQEIPKRS